MERQEPVGLGDDHCAVDVEPCVVVEPLTDRAEEVVVHLEDHQILESRADTEGGGADQHVHLQHVERLKEMSVLFVDLSCHPTVQRSYSCQENDEDDRSVLFKPGQRRRRGELHSTTNMETGWSGDRSGKGERGVFLEQRKVHKEFCY